MNDTFYDISNVINKDIVDIISDIENATKILNISYFIVGAAARDIVNLINGIKSTRLTQDIDIAINVIDWQEYELLTSRLISQYGYKPDNKLKHRYYNAQNSMVDIIPFGEIENPKYSLRWPGADLIMSTLGFMEAYDSCITVSIRRNPDMTTRVPTPASLALMKIISWYDKYPDRSKDAKDLLEIINNYDDYGNWDRFHTEHRDIITGGTYDYNCGLARLLGRDIAKIAKPDTMETLIKILDRETSDDSEYPLIRDMITGLDFDSYRFNKILEIVNSLKLGLTE